MSLGCSGARGASGGLELRYIIGEDYLNSGCMALVSGSECTMQHPALWQLTDAPRTASGLAHNQLTKLIALYITEQQCDNGVRERVPPFIDSYRPNMIIAGARAPIWFRLLCQWTCMYTFSSCYSALACDLCAPHKLWGMKAGLLIKIQILSEFKSKHLWIQLVYFFFIYKILISNAISQFLVIDYDYCVNFF